jgi:mono/diheme cytochrome c family protein
VGRFRALDRAEGSENKVRQEVDEIGRHRDDRCSRACVDHWETSELPPESPTRSAPLKRRNVTLASVAAAGLLLAGSAPLTPISHACAAQAHVSYSEDIAPIFRGWCASCHAPGGEGEKASGLDLSTYERLMKGTKYGPMVIPGKPDESNLVALVQGEAKVRMPFEHKPLPDCLRQNVWSWIFDGAKNN